MKTKPLSFSAWIDQVGKLLVARQLGVTVETVKNWHRGKCFPRVWQMKKIRKISHGLVGYEQIIDGTNE